MRVHSNKHISIIFALLLVFACSDKTVEWTEIALPTNAYKQKTFLFPDNTAKQISYIVDTEYPNKEIFEYYYSALEPSWIFCSDKNKGWESYKDLTGETPVYTHTLINYWANFSKNRLAVLALKYESKVSKAVETPDNKYQNIIFVEYIENNLNKTLKKLSLNCEHA